MDLTLVELGDNGVWFNVVLSEIEMMIFKMLCERGSQEAAHVPKGLLPTSLLDLIT